MAAPLDSPPKVYVLLPAFNEAEALRRLIPDILQALKPRAIPFVLCVVDDGSSDTTAGVVQGFTQECVVRYLRHEKNQGYGAAIKTGVVWGVGAAGPDDWLVSLDADNTHPPEAIPDILKKLQQGYDIVTASYTLPQGQAHGVPFQRRLFSRCINLLLRLRFPLSGVHTYTNGFRGYRVSKLKEAHKRYGESLITESNFAGGTELFLKVARLGSRTGEIPFTLNYERRGSDSKINIPKTIKGYLKLLVLRSFPE